MKRVKLDVISGFVLAALAVAGWFYARATDTPSTIGLTPNTYPELICGVLVVLGLLQAIFSILKLKKDSSGGGEVSVNWKTMLPVLVVLAIYAWCFTLTHFIITTIIFLFVEMLLFGVRKWKVIIPVSIVVPVALYFMFTAFQIPLPGF